MFPKYFFYSSELERLLEEDAGCKDMYEVVNYPDMINMTYL